MSNNLDFVAKLRNSGLRPTKQRIKICQILFGGRETFHFSINELNLHPFSFFNGINCYFHQNNQFLR